VALLAPYGAVNSLGAKLVQLTMPGVPDVYQGTEFWDRSLTDPDNRRPFDFGERQRALAALDAGERPASYLDDAAKLLVTSRALRLRRDRPELFTGYTPVTATGAAAAHLLAFDRGTSSAPGALTLATRLPRGLEQRGGWQDTAIQLAAALTDELTGTTYGPGRVAVGEILRDYPVALLAPAV
jgi:(1->4)-alpha-D-glucan 1-alpha-D-glucosylmutase